jgi:uncharacterized protein
LKPGLHEEHFVMGWAEEGLEERLVRGSVTRPASTPRGGGPYVLLVHGFKGSFRWGFFPELTARLTEAGIAVLGFNLSGSGVGEDLITIDDDAAFEANTFTRELNDIALVRQAVECNDFPWIDPQWGGIFGHSRGGGMALLHAAAHPGLRAVATWSAIDRVAPWDAATVAEWRREGVLRVPNARTGQIHRLGLGLLEDAEQNAEALDIEAACRRLEVPTLLVHAGADESVPPEALERLAAAMPEPLRKVLVVPGAGHTFGARHPLAAVTPDLELVLQETVAWFKHHLRKPAKKPQGRSGRL